MGSGSEQKYILTHLTRKVTATSTRIKMTILPFFRFSPFSNFPTVLSQQLFYRHVILYRHADDTQSYVFIIVVPEVKSSDCSQEQQKCSGNEHSDAGLEEASGGGGLDGGVGL